MFKKLLIVAIVFLTTHCTVAADRIVTNYPPKATEQILQLPQDENKLYLTLYGDPADERYQQVRKWFNENAELKAIRAQTHYAAVDTTSKLFKERYADEVLSAPCLRCVTPGGIELFKLDASQLPMSDRALNNGVRTEFMQKLFGGRNRQQQKQKQESPQDRLKRKIDEKIDEKIDNANLPPVTKYVMSRMMKAFIGLIIAGVILSAFVVALFKVAAEVRAAKQT